MNSNAMKPIMLVVMKHDEDGVLESKDTYFYTTIKEATERAKDFVYAGCQFALYSLYSVGKVPKIQWELNTSPVANTIENRKAAEADKSNGLRKGAYSKRETDLLIEAFNDGFSAAEMAEMLHRDKPALLARLNYLGLSIKKRDAELKKG